ncbi:MAG TPA: hypothetical protein VN030_10715 [Cellvibrio sp.]|nr:hypothetical protein [Cellvibrio sp.]
METLLKTDLALLLARDDAAEDVTPTEDKLTADEDVLILEETDEEVALSEDFCKAGGVDESPPHPLSNRVDINALASSDCLKNMIKFMRVYPFYYGNQ